MGAFSRFIAKTFDNPENTRRRKASLKEAWRLSDFL